jgi:hypothetical protein
MVRAEKLASTTGSSAHSLTRSEKRRSLDGTEPLSNSAYFARKAGEPSGSLTRIFLCPFPRQKYRRRLPRWLVSSKV